MPSTPQINALPYVDFAQRRRLPNSPGIYFALSDAGQVLYVGQTVNLARRWAGHHRVKQLEEIGCTRIAWLGVTDKSQLCP